MSASRMSSSSFSFASELGSIARAFHASIFQTATPIGTRQAYRSGDYDRRRMTGSSQTGSLGAPRDAADAGLIWEIAQACVRWQTATGKACSTRPLREAIWFQWHDPRLPRPRVRSKYPHALPWTAAARAPYAADPKCALVIEHTEPINLLIRRLLTGEIPSATELECALRRGLDCVIVTPAEDKQLHGAGVGTAMPQDWKHGDDRWARYRVAGIDPAFFAPLT